MSYAKGFSGLNSSNDMEEVDDATFLRHGQRGSAYMLANNQNNFNDNNEWEDKRQQLLAERRAIEERTLQSSEISLGLVYDTEKVGQETAQELVRQRDQLNNVEEKLDSMNAMMRVSQKHLTSMKSFFGGFKNYFSKSQDTNVAVNRNVVQNNSNRPTTLLESPVTTQEYYRKPESKPESKPVSISQKIDEQLEENLTELDFGLGRLKNLARDLGSEIDVQNQQIDRITTKAERSEDTLQYQNRQMKRILKNWSQIIGLMDHSIICICSTVMLCLCELYSRLHRIGVIFIYLVKYLFSNDFDEFINAIKINKMK